MITLKINKNVENYEEISNLFFIIWGGDIEKIQAKTKWAFSNPNSLVVTAVDNNQLIAVRGGFKWPLVYNTTQIASYQLHGTCVHPNYRRQGLFTKMTLKFISELENENASLIFNVSVDASKLGYEKIGWKYLDGFRSLTLICKPFNIMNIINYRKNRTIYNTTIDNECQKINIDKNLFKIREEHFVNTIHTKYCNQFFNWRISLGGYKSIQNDSGVLVYKTEFYLTIKSITIGECFLYKNNYSCFCILHNQLIKQENPDTIQINIHNTHPFYNYYRRKLYIPNFMRFNLNFGIKIINSDCEKLINKPFAFSSLDIDTF